MATAVYSAFSIQPTCVVSCQVRFSAKLLRHPELWGTLVPQPLSLCYHDKAIYPFYRLTSIPSPEDQDYAS